MVVLVGGGALLVAVWFAPSDRDPAGLVTAIIAVISGVLGHYFGSRGVERAQQVAEAESDLEREAVAQLAELRRFANEYARILGAARNDPALGERLKRMLKEAEGERK